MKDNKVMITFGPVPSRRFGKSIGINNIPPKICSYSCIYCQLGRTSNIQIERQDFYNPKKVFESVKNKIKKAKEKNERIDFLTFVPDGEPTLDKNIGKHIELIKSLNFKVAVITNSSLLWKKEIKNDLIGADCVSIKIDSVNKDVWKKINRPNRHLKFNKVLSGIKDFSEDFNGELITETMIIKNINDSIKELSMTADFIKDLNSSKSYLSVPIRPPAEKYALSPSEIKLNIAYHIFKERKINIELLTGYEGNDFAFTSNVKDDLLSIISVHPMRKEAIKKFLTKANSNWNIVENLIKDGKIVEIKYKENKYYLRKLHKTNLETKK